MADTEKNVFDTSKLEGCLEKNNQETTNVTKEIKKTQDVITSEMAKLDAGMVLLSPGLPVWGRVLWGCRASSPVPGQEKM